MAEASSTTDDSSAAADSANDRYFCYQCDDRVTNVKDFTCPNCNSGFLEKIEASANEEDDAHRQSQNDSMPSQQDEMDMSQILGQVLGPMFLGASSSRAPGAGATPTQDMFQHFLQQLIGNLGAGGHVQFEYRGGGGGGPGTFSFGLPLHGNPGDYAWGPGGLDEIVTQLLNQFEGGAPPMTRDDIERIPTVTISTEQAEKRLQCTTCMEDFVVNERVRQLPCKHCFHSDCINPWLERHNTCPICRKQCTGVAAASTAQSDQQQQSAASRNIMDQIDELD